MGAIDDIPLDEAASGSVLSTFICYPTLPNTQPEGRTRGVSAYAVGRREILDPMKN
jgi:hypothetical protein